MSATHTPGPWFTFANGHCVGAAHADCGTAGVAMCNMARRSPEENAANAQLMAASPELLAALIELLAAVQTHEKEADAYDNYAGGGGEAESKRVYDAYLSALHRLDMAEQAAGAAIGIAQGGVR